MLASRIKQRISFIFTIMLGGKRNNIAKGIKKKSLRFKTCESDYFVCPQKRNRNFFMGDQLTFYIL